MSSPPLQQIQLEKDQGSAGIASSEEHPFSTATSGDGGVRTTSITPLPSHLGTSDTALARIRQLEGLVAQRDADILRSTQATEQARAELDRAQRAHEHLSQRQIAKPRRADPTDAWTDAPTRDILGLSIIGLDREDPSDARLIAARGALYRWVLSTTQTVLWDSHQPPETPAGALPDPHRITPVLYGQLWPTLTPTQRTYLMRCYRQRVLDIPPLRRLFFFASSVNHSAPMCTNAIEESKVPPSASIFDSDWPMAKMIKEALKNEKDGSKEPSEFLKEFKPLADAISPEQAPVISNPVVRVWRGSRLAHTIERIHSSTHNTNPAPRPNLPEHLVARADTESTAPPAAAPTDRSAGH